TAAVDRCGSIVVMSASMPMRMVPPRTCPVAVGAGPDTTTRAASTPSTSRVLIAVLLVGHRGRSVTGSSCNMGACERVRLPRDPRRVRERIQKDPWAAALGIHYLDLRQGPRRGGCRAQPHDRGPRRGDAGSDADHLRA